MTFGRPPKYPLGSLNVGDYFEWHVPTAKDALRVIKNVSQHGIRNDRSYRCRTDKNTRIMKVLRVR